MTALTAQAAALAELRTENNAMRKLIADMLAVDEKLIADRAKLGHAHCQEAFPFIDRLRAFVRA